VGKMNRSEKKDR